MERTKQLLQSEKLRLEQLKNSQRELNDDYIREEIENSQRRIDFYISKLK
jgi:hypothetical protein